MQIGVSMLINTDVLIPMTDANFNFDTYNSLTPNWYYKVLR